jgi:hypothetical protein
MNRIQINGDWYIKEDQLVEIKNVPQNLIDEDNIIHAKSCLYESDNYAWEATLIRKDNSDTYYDGVDIKFTDKRIKPFKEEYWDNISWIIDIYNNFPTGESSLSALESMDINGVQIFREFIGYLIKIGWIKNQ